MYTAAIGTALVAVTLSAAIFGFFYAWICSTMWGLDAADPRVAIEAMQAMNGSVRNVVFAPAFFGPAPAFCLAAVFAKLCQEHRAMLLFVIAGLVYFLFGLVLTMLVNVPMNEALALISVPVSIDEARQIWQEYSPRWQLFNVLRTIASLLAFWIGLVGLIVLVSRGNAGA